MTLTNGVIAGDIGGTKTNLAWYEAGSRRPRLKVAASYPSRDYSGLEAIVTAFLESHPAAASVDGAGFGIAGPVTGGRTRTTNLPWTVSEAAIAQRFGWPRVRLVNDLTATAMAVPRLMGSELAAVNGRRIRKGENLAVVAPGTGLGLALLVAHDGGYLAVPSEGGHVDFAPTDREEAALWAHLHAAYGHVSAERVLSGPGLVTIYRWLKETGRYREPKWLAAAMASGDPARAVTEAALERKTPIAAAALERFVSIFGAVAGNLALTGMATGGVFLGGGIPPRIQSAIVDGPFMTAFVAKGRFASMLQQIAVAIITNDRAALLGAAMAAMAP